MATHSSVLAWRIPGTEKPGRLQGRTESDTTEVTQQQQQQQQQRYLWWIHVDVWQKPIQYCKVIAAAAAKSLQSCPTLCDPIDGSPPGFSVPGILQARTLEWVASSFSNA